MDDMTLLKEKLDPVLLDIIKERPSIIPVIVQTVDGLKKEDKQIIGSVGGKIKDDLYIINAFSADLSPDAIQSLVLSPRIVRIFYDAEVKAF